MTTSLYGFKRAYTTVHKILAIEPTVYISRPLLIFTRSKSSVMWDFGWAWHDTQNTELTIRWLWPTFRVSPAKTGCHSVSTDSFANGSDLQMTGCRFPFDNLRQGNKRNLKLELFVHVLLIFFYLLGELLHSFVILKGKERTVGCAVKLFECRILINFKPIDASTIGKTRTAERNGRGDAHDQ